MTYYVYVIECKDNSVYVGITQNPTHRISQHKSGKGSMHTKLYGFKRLLSCTILSHNDLKYAKTVERYVYETLKLAYKNVYGAGHTS